MDLDPEARRVLELAREARTPSEEDKQRVARRIATGLGLSVVAGAAGAAAQGAGASVSAGAAKSAGAAVLLKWWIAGGAVVVAAVSGFVVLSSGAGEVAAPKVPVTAPVQVQDLATPTPTPTLTPAVAPVAAPEPGPERTVQRRRPGAAATLPAELELLHEAQAAWRAHDARGALSLIDKHRARYPRSSLRAEREGLQVLSLCELGRKAEAGRVARRLLARTPHSPMRAAIEQSCALE